MFASKFKPKSKPVPKKVAPKRIFIERGREFSLTFTIIFLRMLTLPSWLIKYKKPIVITLSLVLLQWAFGFDPKFTLINLIWLLF